MNRCETCRHWELLMTAETGGMEGLGRCRNTPIFWDATKWEGSGEMGENAVRVLHYPYRDTRSFVQDGGNYDAYLMTTPDFGCVDYAPDTE